MVKLHIFRLGYVFFSKLHSKDEYLALRGLEFLSAISIFNIIFNKLGWIK